MTTKDISTHTLTWSVTWKGVLNNDDQRHFNSHAHVERDDDTDDVKRRV